MRTNLREQRLFMAFIWIMECLFNRFILYTYVYMEGVGSLWLLLNAI